MKSSELLRRTLGISIGLTLIMLVGYFQKYPVTYWNGVLATVTAVLAGIAFMGGVPGTQKFNDPFSIALTWLVGVVLASLLLALVIFITHLGL